MEASSSFHIFYRRSRLLRLACVEAEVTINTNNALAQPVGVLYNGFRELYVVDCYTLGVYRLWKT